MGLGAWEDRPQDKKLLLIGIPHTGLTLFEWGVSFKVLMPPVPYNVISNKGLPIDRARCDLVEQAYSMGATHLFFQDSDVLIPPDGLIKLWNHRLPIVCGVYGSKHGAPGVWIQQQVSGGAKYAAVTAEALERFPLFSHPDIVVGGGCALIDMNVFRKLEKPYFKWTQGVEQDGVSEDFYFFEKCRKAGIPIHVDTTVRCLHGEFAARNWKGELQRLQV